MPCTPRWPGGNTNEGAPDDQQRGRGGDADAVDELVVGAQLALCRKPEHASVGIRTRSFQSATSGSSPPAVHICPENYKVVHPRGSQRASHRPVVLPAWK
jgi:hypothetical protein